MVEICISSINKIFYQREYDKMEKKERKVDKNTVLKIGEWIIVGILFPLLVIRIDSLNKTINEFDLVKSEMSITMDDVSADMDDIKTDVNYIQDNMVSKEKFEDLEDDLSDLETSIAKIEKELKEEINEMRPYIGVIYHMDESVIGKLFTSSNYAIGEVEGLKKLQWSDSQEIATNIKTGKKYTAEQLVGKPLLIPYTYEGKEVYFVGQYDANNQWDGKCIFNVYQGNKLEVITEATYENGIMKEYRQVYDFVTEQGKKVWAVSNRIKKEGFSSGETTTYIKNDEWMKHFNATNVTYGDILTVEQLGMNVTTRIEGYYNGNIAGGSFSDNTGNAYWVKYTEEGLVRYLYQGKVSEGNFNDDTGNAWYIIRGEEGKYIYYKGRFRNGERVDEGYENNITQERINEIITDKNFECELKWSVEQQDNL